LAGTLGTAQPLINEFEVVNHSARVVTSIEYGWRIAAATGCAESTLPAHWETATAYLKMIPDSNATIMTAEALSKVGAAAALSARARASRQRGF